MSAPSPLIPSAQPTSIQIHSIIAAAHWSPSGDNCQPWRLAWNGSALAISHDESRAAHSLNPENVASLLTLGTLLETIKIKASAEGFSTEWTLNPISQAEWATVRFSPGAEPDSLGRSLARRWTDRRRYRQLPLSAKHLSYVQGEQEFFPSLKVTTLLFTPELVELLAETEVCSLFTNRFSNDIYRWVRFTRKKAFQTRDGLHWSTLGVGIDQLPPFFLMQNPIIRRALSKVGARSAVRKYARKRLSASAGYFCISGEPSELIEAGRLGLRLWTRFNDAGESVQPLSFVPLMSVAGEMGLEGLPRQAVELAFRGRDLLRKNTAVPENKHPLWLFRFGQPLGDKPENYLNLRTFE